MNREVIQANKPQFDYWVAGGKIVKGVEKNNKIVWMLPAICILWGCENVIYLINDEFIEYRKALAEGKVVQYKMGKYEDGRIYYKAETGTFKMPLESYSIKPENKPFWEAEDGKKGWQINANGSTTCVKFWGKDDKHLAHETRELAEKTNELNKAKWRVEKRIYELNGNEKMEFTLIKSNWSFNLTEGILVVNYLKCSKFYPHWQYLKSKELGEQLLEEMPEDCMLIRSE